MPAFKPETSAAVPPASMRDFDVSFRFEDDASGKPRFFCTVTPHHGNGRAETFKLGQVECAENPKAKRAACRAVLGELVSMWLASRVDGAAPVVVPSDEDEPVTPPPVGP